MAFYSRSQVIQLAGAMTTGQKKQADVRTKAAAEKRSKVFLSHSHDDKVFDNLVESARRILGDQEIELYVDSEDSEMPKTTDIVTAQLLKVRIGEFGKFILLSTKRSRASVWCGWELGVADSLIEVPNVLIWHITEGAALAEDVAENEYLGMYRRLVHDWANSKDPRVLSPGQNIDMGERGISLADWLAS